MNPVKLHVCLRQHKPAIFEHVARWGELSLRLPVKRVYLATKAVISDGYIRCRPIKINKRVLEVLQARESIPEPFQFFVYDRPEKHAVKLKNGVVYNSGQLFTQVYAAV